MNMNTFPLTFEQHLVFCIVAVLFMVLQFVRQRYWYQLVIAAAVGSSLLIYVNESTNWFYGIGVLELVLMIAALVLYVVQSRKLAKAEKSDEQAQAAADDSGATPVRDMNIDVMVADPAESENAAAAEKAADEAAAGSTAEENI